MRHAIQRQRTIVARLQREIERKVGAIGQAMREKPSASAMQDRKRLKQRQAIEPIIGHSKQDHRMDHCHLKDE